MRSDFKAFKSEEIVDAPLIIDAVYEALGGSMVYEPLSRMFKCSNQGGFRAVKNGESGYKFIILYSSLDDHDWPDSIDIHSGTVVYYGDNKRPGNSIHSTPIGGNKILRNYFDFLHSGCRGDISPIFFFTKGAKARDVVFRGLLVPGATHISENEDLVAIWKSKEGKRFQNYRAIFTVLDAGTIHRKWIDSLASGKPSSQYAPKSWLEWKASSSPPRALITERIATHRSKSEQLPSTASDTYLLEQIHTSFTSDPFSFEKCAAELVKLMDKNVVSYELTRKSRDGGIDAHAEYRIGLSSNSIKVSCAIEAKCYRPDTPVGVKGTSRLISRLKNREFGVLVTTSYVDQQAYKEIIEDGHPVIIMSGVDIVNILKSSGVSSPELLTQWLKSFLSNAGSG